jgi:hypothetical protein
MSLGLKARPDVDAPAFDFLLVPLSGAYDRHLRRPVEFLQEPGDMALVIANAELLFDDLADSSTGPDLAEKAVGLRAVSEKVGDQAHLFRFESRGTPRNGLSEQPDRSIETGPSHPPTDGRLADIERDGDFGLAPTIFADFRGSPSCLFCTQLSLVERTFFPGSDRV